MTAVNKRILVIDDDQEIWKAYQGVLAPDNKRSGSNLEQMSALLAWHSDFVPDYNTVQFQLSFASQGQEGVALVQSALEEENPFPLVFIDVRMPPGWDGMETACRIRALDPNIEIVIVTAYADRSCEEIVRNVGSPSKILFIRKPFDQEELKQLAVSLSDKWYISRQEEEQRRKLESLLSTSPAAIFTVDDSWRILSWNPAAETITGYSEQEVLNQPCIFREISDDSICGRCLDENDQVAIPENRQFTIRDKQGQRKVLSMHMANVPEEKKWCSSRNICSFWDISSIKETELVLARTNQELQEKIVALEKLQEEQRTLEKQLHQAQKMEAIGLMAGGVAHDLNNILSGLINYPELILLKLPPDSDLRKYVTSMQAAGQRAAAVVADLLTFARGVTVVREPANLNKLIVEYLESPEGEKLLGIYPDVRIKTSLAPKGAFISCSPVHIKKCLMNLLTNAAEAINGAGWINITSSVEEKEETVGLEGKDGGSKVVLSVADSGPGIAKQDLERIFEPFYSRKELGRSGTGLGLAVVWNCVQNHKGTIEVTSSSEGTIFTLTFPGTSQRPVAKDQSIPLHQLQGTGTVLVVDDEAQQRDIASNLLTMLGYTVKTARSGEDAVTFMLNHSVDLVLLDMILKSGMNGRETYEQIMKINPDQKALVVSGFSENKEVEKAIALGVDGYIKKPFSLEVLGLAIRKAIAA